MALFSQKTKFSAERERSLYLFPSFANLSDLQGATPHVNTGELGALAPGTMLAEPRAICMRMCPGSATILAAFNSGGHSRSQQRTHASENRCKDAGGCYEKD
jgi:hypothetical protein